MGSLFVKLFLWFWLAMLAMGAALLITRHYWTPMADLPDAGELADYAEEIQRLRAQEGIGAVVGYLRAAGHEERLRLSLVRTGEDSGFGRRLPPELREELDSLSEPGTFREGRAGRLYYRALALDVGDGSTRYLVAMRPAAGMFELPVWLRLLVALLVTGVVSALLANHLSTPLRRVREASRRLAEGDLDARVPAPRRGGDELNALGRDFNVMAERLQQAVETRTRLLRDISHELRSPLARMQAALGLARRKGGEGGDGYLDRMERDIEQLDQLIGQVLAMARLDAGDARQCREVVDVSALLEEICDDAAFEARAMGREVVLSELAPCLLQADRMLLRSALDNVIRNAVRYTATGTTVRVRAELAGSELVVRVDDAGPGVPAHQLEAIFEPFVRVSEARDRESGGHGLGLAIARRAVEAHGGTITARNREEGGLRVCLRLPGARPP